MPILILAVAGLLLVGGGLWVGSWWIVAGGVVALTGSAWLVTDPT